MKIKKGESVFGLLSSLQKMLHEKPSVKQMFNEIQMMKFKIRPVSGDISLVDIGNSQLIEALWGLGKLDDFFQKEFKRLSGKEKRIFFNIVSGVKEKLEQELNRVNFKQSMGPSSIVEVEIFKDTPARKPN
ncbi:hypothetical protein GYA28_01650 [Candidatus Roizmanbacteria bacterium]|jgi:uncharacterized radical SAM superfamily protein|nr:hypothetical protein [Candidatus Roizmanbacteria bacterium]